MASDDITFDNLRDLCATSQPLAGCVHSVLGMSDGSLRLIMRGDTDLQIESNRLEVLALLSWSGLNARLIGIDYIAVERE